MFHGFLTAFLLAFVSAFSAGPAALPEAPAETVVTNLPATFSSSVFARCGTTADFKNESWYPTLLAEAGKHYMLSDARAAKDWEFNKETYPTPQELQKRIGMISEGTIPSMCIAENSGLVILMAGTDYMLRGHLFVFDTKNGSLSEIQDHPDAGDHQSFQKFEPQQGTMLPLTAAFGDAGHMSETRYELDITKATLIPRSMKNCNYDWEAEKQNCEEEKL